MYDSTTTDLIRGTPPLQDLDRNALPDQLTKAFAQITSVRVQLRAKGEPLESLGKTRQFAKRLAQTNEALVVLTPNRKDRRAAAFVAATAYQLVHQIDALSGVENPSTHLTTTSITADVSSMLLFLVAESTADATEVSQRIILPDSKMRLEQELLRSLNELARGQVSSTVQRSLIEVEETVLSATDALYHLILRGVRCLASVLAGLPLPDDPSSILRQAKELAGRPDGGFLRSDTPEPSSDTFGLAWVAIFPGPYHLASLLLAVADTLAGAAVVRVAPPNGVDPVQWQSLMRTLAMERPYLWPNHQDAISKQYLQAGTSSVVGFPTGAGKSAVFQLKIGAALLAGRRLIFLAPTHALVDQTKRDLERVFPTASIIRERSDEVTFSTSAGLTPDILIMTPEKCLLIQHIEPDALKDVGLLVFDECHLVHPRIDTDRRAIDAMLCIVNVINLAPSADLLLLSAMMKNTGEVAGWIASLTERNALAFDMAWKPTRQLRGCVVYEQQRIRELNDGLLQARRTWQTNAPPAAVKRDLTARPHGFFSIKQTWISQNRSDYTCLPLCKESPALGANAQWKLTPNAGVVAAALAVPAAKAGVNALIFSQSISMASAIAKRASESLGFCTVELMDDERHWATVAIDELGGSNQLFVDVRDDLLTVRAATHHGLLLPEERRLIESLYARPGGLAVLSATSTLGQGMNLPSELVIIAEDSRFDERLGQRELLEPRELLNAAGRAGRAGRNATGIVVVVPGRVVGFDEDESRIGQRWAHLREIFSQTDQCLIIDDPLTAILDRVHSQVQPLSDLDRYVVSRLCGPWDPDDEETEVREKIQRTFAAFRKRCAGDDAWIERCTEGALALLGEMDPDDETANVVRELASSLGFPEDVISELRVDLLDAAPSSHASVAVWRQWVFDWMVSHPEQTMRMFRPEELTQQFGSKFKQIEGDKGRVQYALPKLMIALEHWMGGRPLTDIQNVFDGSGADGKKSIAARKFVIRVLPTLAHVFTALPRILSEVMGPMETLQDQAPTVFHLGRCVRRGFSSIEMYALHEYFQPSVPLSRREVHRRFSKVAEHLLAAPSEEPWPDVKVRVETAWRTVKSTAESHD